MVPVPVVTAATAVTVEVTSLVAFTHGLATSFHFRWSTRVANDRSFNSLTLR
jgi:hypothetical protein